MQDLTVELAVFLPEMKWGQLPLLPWSVSHAVPGVQSRSLAAGKAC